MDKITNFIEKIFEDQYTKAFGSHFTPQTSSRQITLTRQDGTDLIAVLQAKCVLDNAHITALVVSPDHQGKGLGSSLIQEFETLMKKDKISSITLSTKSYQAEGFYQKMGYQIYASLEDVPKEGITKYHLIKRLNP